MRSHLHTVAQTLVGAALGASFSLLWLFLEYFALSVESYCIAVLGHSPMLCNQVLDNTLLDQIRLEYKHGSGPHLALKLVTLCCAIGAIYIYKRNTAIGGSPQYIDEAQKYVESSYGTIGSSEAKRRPAR